MHQTLGAGVKTRSGKIPDSRMATCSGVATLPCTTKILSAQAHACQQRLTPSSLLCTEAIREHSNQSSKLVAALRCEAESDANCSPVWPALEGATLPTKVAVFLSLCLCTDQSDQSDQSSKLVATMQCEAKANCSPVWPALARLAS